MRSQSALTETDIIREEIPKDSQISRSRVDEEQTSNASAPDKAFGIDHSGSLRTDALAAQSNEIATATKGTCEWIYSHPKYVEWRQSEDPNGHVLVVLADPGLGKSVLAKSISIKLMKDVENGGCVMAFFCKKGLSRRESTTSVIATFLHKLLIQQKSLYRYITEPISDSTDKISFQQLWKLFAAVTQDPSIQNYTFIIDALDECETSSQQQLMKSFLDPEFCLRSRLLITARPERYPEALGKRFSCIRMEAESVSADITTFINDVLRTRGYEDLYNHEMIELLKENMNSETQGMFLRVSIMIDEFDDARDDPDFSTSPVSLKQYFNRSSGKLGDYYRVMVANTIAHLSPESKTAAADILNILLALQIPASEIALRAAYAFSQSSYATYSDFLSRSESNIIERAKRLCGPITRTRPMSEADSSTISITHPTAREFLETYTAPTSVNSVSTFLATVNRESGHILMAKACLSILLLPEVISIGRRPFDSFPFLAYAVLFLPLHIRESGKSFMECANLLRDFFSRGSEAYSSWSILYSYLTIDESPTPAPPVIINLVRQGLDQLIDAITYQKGGSAYFLGQPIDINAVDEKGNTALMLATSGGRSELAIKLLDLGASTQISNEDCETPLHVAVQLRLKELIYSLVSHGASLDVETKVTGRYEDRTHGMAPVFYALASLEVFDQILELGAARFCRTIDNWSILHEAALRGDFQMVAHILQRRLVTNVDQTTIDGITALHVAVGPVESLETVKYLVEMQGASPNQLSAEGRNPLYEAASNGDIESVSYLLPRTVDKDASQFIWSPLHAAAFDGFLEIVKVLIEGRVNVERLNDNGETALSIAIKEGHTAVARTLLEAMHNVDCHGSESKSPLFHACVIGNSEIATKLLSRGANSRFAMGKVSCLHLAAWEGHVGIVEALIAARAPGNDLDEIEPVSGWTPLLAALHKGRLEVAKCLVHAGADTKITSLSGYNVLHKAGSSTKDVEFFRLLIDSTTPDHALAKSDDSTTPLHSAAQAGFNEAVNMLLDLKADPLAQDNYSTTPIFDAAINGHSHVLKRFLDMEIEFLPDLQTSAGGTVLHAAVERCELPLIQKLIKETSWRIRKASTVTPMVLAARRGDPFVIELLIEAGMPVGFSSNTGWTALHEAASRGDAKLISRLIELGADRSRLDSDNSIPLSEAYGYNDDTLLQQLEPPDNTASQKSFSALSSCVHFAAFVAPQSVQRLVDLGASLECWSAERLTSLHWSAKWDCPNTMQYLLEQPGVINQINVQSRIYGRTPLLTASAACNVKCIERLLDAGADPAIRDIYGYNAFDYARKDKDSFFVLLSASNKRTAFSTPESPEERKKRMIILICDAIDWIKGNRGVQNRPCYYDLDRASILSIMISALLYVNDVENALTASEVRIGPPSSLTVTMSWNCSFCGQRNQPPYHICLICLGRDMCQDCKEKIGKERVKGCYNHQITQVPRPSWFTRGREEVTEDKLSEDQWLEQLGDTYGSQRDPTSKVVNLNTFMSDLDDAKPSVFDLCRLPDTSHLQDHLNLYPRDIALRDSNGASLAMISIGVAASDEDALHRLQHLRSNGCRPLVWDTAETSTVKLACQKYFGQTLAFLMDQFDSDFDRFKDPYTVDAIQTMISKRWRPALLATIERHFDWAARDKFAWLEDFRLLGLSDVEITDLLLKPQELAFDTPSHVDGSWWTLTQPRSSRRPLIGKHREQCACNINSNVVNLRNEYRDRGDELEAKSDTLSSSSDGTSTIDTILAMCGLAGAFPTASNSVKFESFADEGVSVSIAYASSLDQDHQSSLETVRKAGDGLLEAMRSSQEASLCCDSFSILYNEELAAEEKRPITVVMRFNFEQVSLLVDAIGEKHSAVAQDDWKTRVTYTIAAISNTHSDTRADPFGSDLEDTFEEVLDKCCLVMQVLCLGFSLYLNGHLYSCHLPFLKAKITTFVLQGLGRRRCIIFHARNLACVGDMLGDQVFAFSRNHAGQHSRTATKEAERCALLTRPMDVIDLWGPAQCILAPSIVGSSKGILQAVELLDGHFALDGGEEEGIKTAHWSPTPYHETLAVDLFRIDQRILLGTLHRNDRCHFNMGQAWARANDSSLEELNTRASFWALANRTMNVGFNAIYANGGIAGQQTRNSNWSSKAAVMAEWADQRSRALTRPWGMLFSVCTGFAKRVPLREAIGQVFLTYLEGNDLVGPNGETTPSNWQSTKRIAEENLKGNRDNTDEVNNAAFVDYYNGLSILDKGFVRAAITFVLQHLKQTGLDSAGTSFKVAWADLRDPFQALEFPCSGEDRWTKIFEDSRRTATFAVATSECLVSHHFRSPFAANASCRYLKETGIDPIPIKLIETKLLPYNLKGPALSNWSLHCSNRYSFLMENSTNRLCILKEVGQRRHCRRFLLIMGSWTDIPWQVREELLRLVNKEEVVRENHQPYEHVGPGGPQPAIICSMSQWRKENNMSGT